MTIVMLYILWTQKQSKDAQLELMYVNDIQGGKNPLETSSVHFWLVKWLNLSWLVKW